MNQTRHILRTATARNHERVDAAFAAFDLADAESYRRFLSAHARVLTAVERAIHIDWAGWTRRMPLILQDLQDLGASASFPDNDLGLTEPASQWGGLYVLEGSRLGGAMLAKRVGRGLPRRYLSAAHTGGSWQAFQDALEAAAQPADPDWMDTAIGAAQSVFEFFEDAARLELAGIS